MKPVLIACAAAELSSAVRNDRVLTDEQKAVMMEKLGWICAYAERKYDEQYVLSADPDYDLTLESAYSKIQPSPLTRIHIPDRMRAGQDVLQRKEQKTGAKPYVRIRDFANPFGDRDDFDAGSDGMRGIEAGVRFRF